MRIFSVFDNKMVWALFSSFVLLTSFFWVSLEESLFVTDLHLDGVYQTASAMMRVKNGDSVGKDFFFYLGIGPLYSIYPIFALLGGDVSASIAASHLAVKVSFFITVLCFCRLVFRFSCWPRVVVFAIAIYLILEYVTIHYGMYFRYPSLSTYLDPGNSLRPLRRFAPILGAIAVWHSFRIKDPLLHTTALGVISGTMAIWSNDLGVPTAAAIFIFVFWKSLIDRSSVKSFLLHCMLFFLAALIWFFLLLSIITQGYAPEWLNYNFRGVAGDQWWYYEPYVKGRIWRVSDVLMIFDRGLNFTLSWAIIISVFLLPFLFIQAFFLKSIHKLLLFYIGICLFGGALISEVFGHKDDFYWAGLMPWVVFSILSIFVEVYRKVNLNKLSAVIPNKTSQMFSALTISSIFLLVFLRSLSSYEFFKNQKINYSQDESKYSAELGGYVSEDTMEYLQYIKYLRDSNAEGFLLTEEYFGLASALGYSQSPVSFDSVIHALGVSSRELYLEQLQRSKYVVTTNPAFSPWQAWSISQNWWFYKSVLKNFRPLKLFKTVIVWGRAESPKVSNSESHDCLVRETEDGYAFDLFPFPEKKTMGLIKLNYKIRDRSSRRALILLETNLSHYHGYASLDLSAESFETPIFIMGRMKESGVLLHVLPAGNDDSYLVIETCEVEYLGDKGDLVYFDDRYVPINRTGDGLIGGLEINNPSFVVINSLDNKIAYQKGKKIQFSNGDIREIVDTVEYVWGGRLRVRYTGDSLAKEGVGYPNRIYAVEEN